MDGRKEGALVVGGPGSPSSILISVVAASLFLSVCSGLQFDISALQKKCFTEELNVKGLVLANYRLISDNTTKISSKVTSPYGGTLHSAERVSEGDFAFNANEAGEYIACFWISDASKESEATVELEWKTGVAAKDWDSVAKREKIEGVELELLRLQDAVKHIHNNMMYLRDKEEKMRHINEVTNARMAWFSISSLSLCLVMAALQLWYLKSFFVRKKLL